MLSVGEIATHTGLTVRTLHHWETKNLVTPIRSENGTRYYGAKQLIRIGQIQLLKSAGLKLSDIKALLDGHIVDQADFLRTQIHILEQKQQELTITIGTLTKAVTNLGKNDSVSLHHLCTALKNGRESMSQEDWQSIYDTYYSKEEQKQWADAKTQFVSEIGVGGIRDYEQKWQTLIIRIEAMITAHVSPKSDEAKQAAKDWHTLMQPLFEKNPTLKAGANRMYDDMENWDQKTEGKAPKAPFSPAVWSFIKEASATLS